MIHYGRLSAKEIQQLKSKLLQEKSKLSRSIRALEEAALRKMREDQDRGGGASQGGMGGMGVSQHISA